MLKHKNIPALVKVESALFEMFNTFIKIHYNNEIHPLQPSMLYRLLIGVIRLRLPREQIENRLYM